MEQFDNWKEAERYFLPEFKEATDAQNGATDVSPSKDSEDQAAESVTEASSESRSLNEMSQMLLSKLNFKKDPDSDSVASAGTCSVPPSPTSGGSRASPECSSRQLENGKANNKVKLDKTAADDNDNDTKYVVPAVPAAIKSLLNSTLWRLHSLSETPAAANGCILVTNDRLTQAWAQKFGITVKTIPQLRTSIIYEEKEFKNHCKYMEKNQAQSQSLEPKPLLSYEDESDEDVLVFVPRKQGKAGAQGGTTPTRPAAKDTTTANRVASAAMNPNGKSGAKHVSPEPSLEVPSAPIDPDSFSRTTGATKQHPPIDPIPTGAANRGLGGPAPRGNGNRRGGGSRGGMLRGAGRGRGRLWVP